ncbi:MAG: MaoC family dehydratase [Candidatus Poribacteria bacterium]|nr:MaoC family dehydratase [Candidatus Poribacteria bacterium]
MAESEKKIKTGWEGRFYEDFEVGDVYRSRFGRTVTEADNTLFTHLTLNTNPLHFDARYTERTKWGKILVNSTFTLALITGMSVSDVSENAMANLGWEEIKLPNPVFLGDTLYCETEVLAKRESKSYPEAGIIRVRSRGINQDGQVVINFTRSIMVYKRGNSPKKDLFPEVEVGS